MGELYMSTTQLLAALCIDVENGREANDGSSANGFVRSSREPKLGVTTHHGDPAKQGVSVVMVSYRTGPVLFAAIDSVLSQTQEAVVELILIDNGNPPEAIAELRRREEADSRLTLISGHGNVGFSRGCNIGADRARGRYLLLLNPDCCLGLGAVPALLAEAVALGESWMIGCRVLNPDGSDQRGSRRALLTPYTAVVEALRLYRLAPRLFASHRLNYHERPLPDGSVRMPAVSGACMLLPAETFQAVGGMDEGYFLHVEDLDLFHRLHRARIPVFFVPHVEVVHQLSSSQASPIRIEWHKTRGFIRYFRAHCRGLVWAFVAVPLVFAVLARFGARATRSLFQSAWKPMASREPIVSSDERTQ